MTTAWDLAGDWTLLEDADGFVVGNGTTVWEDARATANERVRIARLVPGENGIRQVNRYVDPDQPVRVVRNERRNG